MMRNVSIEDICINIIIVIGQNIINKHSTLRVMRIGWSIRGWNPWVKSINKVVSGLTIITIPSIGTIDSIHCSISACRLCRALVLPKQSPWLLDTILDGLPLEHNIPASWHSFCQPQKDDKQSTKPGINSTAKWDLNSGSSNPMPTTQTFKPTPGMHPHYI